MNTSVLAVGFVLGLGAGVMFSDLVVSPSYTVSAQEVPVYYDIEEIKYSPPSSGNNYGGGSGGSCG